LAPLRGFRDDDGSLQWKAIRRHLKSVWYIQRWRVENRLLDVYAVLRGACNASTWDPERADYSGGYSHWRCGKRRGHATEHRFMNYVWDGDGSPVRFDPLPLRVDGEWFDWRTAQPFRKLVEKRHVVDSRRRGRIRARAAAIQMAAYRVDRRVDRSAGLKGAIEASFRRHHLDDTAMPTFDPSGSAPDGGNWPEDPHPR